MQSGRTLHPAGADQVGEPHRKPDQDGPLSDRHDDIAELVPELFE